LEPTPDAYVAKLVEVFREVRRVLRDDGTLWLNLGDSYAQGEIRHRQGQGSDSEKFCDKADQDWSKGTAQTGRKLNHGCKPKDLIGIPWRVAFALQADGWYLRQDIIWHKPNPMPESVTDRCTKAHEYLFLLAKSERYFYDAGAIADACNDAPVSWEDRKAAGEPMRRGMKASGDHKDPHLGCSANGTRNRRSVWTVATQPYKGAHFATFPPALITPCILAGCPQGGTVGDPFGGSGTTGEVAEACGRNSVLIELNPQYVELQKVRTAQGGLFCFPVDGAGAER
jgi:DNA modification methylase